MAKNESNGITSMASKIDEVSRNQIWREQLKKERKMEGEVTPFQFNPKTLNAITLKPTLVDPSEYNENSKGSKIQEIEGRINKDGKNPQENYEFPITEAQGIGWMHDQAYRSDRAKVNARWYRGKGSSDITRFADAYCTMSGCSPFADKSTR